MTINCDLYTSDGSRPLAGSPIYARCWSDAASPVNYSGLILEDGRLIFRLPDCADTGGANIEVIYPGCKVWSGRGLMSGEGPAIHLEEGENPFRKPSEAAGVIGVSGQFFTLNGQPWTAIQASAFNLFGRFLNGEDIKPFLVQHQSIGFNLLRVWTRYDLAQYGIGRCTLSDHPDLYDRIPAFVNLCAQHGLFVEFTAYTGHEDFDPAHWSLLAASCLLAQTLPLLELVNENDQSGNHIDVSKFTAIPGLLCSHGSNGSSQAPVQPYWQYVTFHTNGAGEEQRKVGHNALELWAGPSLTNETSRYPDVGMWRGASIARVQQLAFDSAAGASLLCAGSCFHSVHGKDASLLSGDSLTAAQWWVMGARSVDPACHIFSYTHRIDLEGPNDLRVYQRGNPIVHIRK